MFRLTREVRFALNPDPDDQLNQKPANSFGGYPSLTGLGRYYTIRITLAGDLDPRTSYLLNIKAVDALVRQRVIPRMQNYSGSAEALVRELYSLLFNAWPGAALHQLQVILTPTLNLSLIASEFPMVRLSQKFEFSASHRLHSAQLSDEENLQCFGKCNNPQGHGHNYEVEVTLRASDANPTLLKCLPSFERTVAETVIDAFDHRNLNVEVPEFRELIPTVENIAMVIYRMLKPKFQSEKAQLASVTVWETPKTWCEYSE
ncbi:MAG TPA: 6-carboxytetrahydropterin synthase [Tepidisphaeraceae bacterium]|jgi:6-pyruvoyltetrahydropterin/6-carboxytetrahydropterin synthase